MDDDLLLQPCESPVWPYSAQSHPPAHTFLSTPSVSGQSNTSSNTLSTYPSSTSSASLPRYHASRQLFASSPPDYPPCGLPRPRRPSVLKHPIILEEDHHEYPDHEILDRLISLSSHLLAASTAALAATVTSRTSLASLSRVEVLLDRSIRTRERELSRRLDAFEEHKVALDGIERELHGWPCSASYHARVRACDEEAELTRTIVAAERVGMQTRPTWPDAGRRAASSVRLDGPSASALLVHVDGLAGSAPSPSDVAPQASALLATLAQARALRTAPQRPSTALVPTRTSLPPLPRPLSSPGVFSTPTDSRSGRTRLRLNTNLSSSWGHNKDGLTPDRSTHQRWLNSPLHRLRRLGSLASLFESSK